MMMLTTVLLLVLVLVLVLVLLPWWASQVYVKASAFFRNSEFAYPFSDVRKKVAELVG